MGDKVTLISPQGQVTPAGLIPRLRQFTVVGLFETVGQAMPHTEIKIVDADDKLPYGQVVTAVGGPYLNALAADAAGPDGVLTPPEFDVAGYLAAVGRCREVAAEPTTLAAVGLVEPDELLRRFAAEHVVCSMQPKG